MFYICRASSPIAIALGEPITLSKNGFPGKTNKVPFLYFPRSLISFLCMYLVSSLSSSGSTTIVPLPNLNPSHGTALQTHRVDIVALHKRRGTVRREGEIR